MWRIVDITHVSEGRDEALLVLHLQLVVLLVLPPPPDIVEEGPDGCGLRGRGFCLFGETGFEGLESGKDLGHVGFESGGFGFGWRCG